MEDARVADVGGVSGKTGEAAGDGDAGCEHEDDSGRDGDRPDADNDNDDEKESGGRPIPVNEVAVVGIEADAEAGFIALLSVV